MIDPTVMQAIDRLEAFQETVDNAWNIPRAEGLVLHNIVLASRCHHLVEVGTSYGFSTLFLAAAAKVHGGAVHTYDIDPAKHDAARKTLADAGLADTVHLHTGDARKLLAELDEGVDFAFLDAWKDETFDYFAALEPKLAQRCVLALDNTATHPEQLGPFVEMLRGRADFTCCDVPIGNGFELAVRAG